MSRAREKRQRIRTWQPMTRGLSNPRYMASVYPNGLPDGVTHTEAWGNDLYQATVEQHESGWSYITLKRHDRHAVRDWRHLQSIKNEICGPEREAIEIFPAESRLMDTSNQYHLWVLPEGEMISFGPMDRAVCSPDEVREFNRESVAAGTGPGLARQREWQPGLSTGPGA